MNFYVQLMPLVFHITLCKLLDKETFLLMNK